MFFVLSNTFKESVVHLSTKKEIIQGAWLLGWCGYIACVCLRLVSLLGNER